jgi:hypothetical protein
MEGWKRRDDDKDGGREEVREREREKPNEGERDGVVIMWATKGERSRRKARTEGRSRRE